MKDNIFGLTAEEIEMALSPWRTPLYRGRQIAQWMYQKGARSFAAMGNLPLALRGALDDAFTIERPALLGEWNSADGCTAKFLLGFSDGAAVESVLMRQKYGNSICISTQAGCAMGCAFCASTLHGEERSLTIGEMLGEILFIEERLRTGGEKVDTIVLMGSGEPMMNYDNVLGLLRLIHEKYCLNFGYRHITLSTAGIVPGIERLAEEKIPVTLSISLHAPNDRLRTRLMPINRRYPVAAVIAAGSAYAMTTKRRVTYEYILIADVNDGEEQAEALSRLLQGQLANVNLIPINPVRERSWKRPSEDRIMRFANVLAKNHIAATVRKEMGNDIQAACGQLRNQYIGKLQR